jgi:parvulin-like peptidyl-prolyl isomerase
MKQKHFLITISILIFAVIMGGCSLTPGNAVLTPTASTPLIPTATSGPTITPTEVINYVASVNGIGIHQASFDASLVQFQAALELYPELLPEDRTAEEVVLESLIQRALLSQAAQENGFTADAQMVVSRLSELIDKAGGQEALTAWLDENGYSEEAFLDDLPLEIEAAWQRDQIAGAVPEAMEQIRARQIFFTDGYQATRAYNQLEAGIPFDTVAENNSPNDPGYIDWFPRGYLIYPEIETIVFDLQPGQYTSVIETDAGFHIIYILGREPQHPLSSEARLALQQQAVQQWLAEQQAQSQVEIYTP